MEAYPGEPREPYPRPEPDRLAGRRAAALRSPPDPAARFEPRRPPIRLRRRRPKTGFAAWPRYEDAAATLDDVRKGVEILESVAPLWKRVFGPAHPETPCVQNALKDARKTLAARAA